MERTVVGLKVCLGLHIDIQSNGHVQINFIYEAWSFGFVSLMYLIWFLCNACSYGC